MEGEEKFPGGDKEWRRLMKAWTLGDVLLSLSFKDAVLDAILHKMFVKDAYPTRMFSQAYLNSSNGAAIRRLMVDIAVYRWDEDDMSQFVSEDRRAGVFPFFQSVSVALLKWKRQPEAEKKAEDPTKLLGTCLYHEHGDKPCYKTMF